MTTIKEQQASASSAADGILPVGRPQAKSGDLQRGQTGTSDQDGENSDLGDRGGDSQAGRTANDPRDASGVDAVARVSIERD